MGTPVTSATTGDAEPTWRKHWPAFEAMMQARLDAGHLEYGDASFERLPSALLEEISEEMADVVGWAFMLWVRLQRLKDRARGV
jgi:hypothetical protein